MELKLNPRKETRMNHKTRDQYWAKGWVPAAVHGRSIEPGICFVDTKHSSHWHRGSMFDVSWNGQPFKASIDELQFTPVGNKLVHVSFHLVGKNEVAHIDVPVRVVGNAPGEKQGGMVQVQLESLTVAGKPDDIPEFYEVSVDALGVGENISVGDLSAPKGCKWYNLEDERTVVTCAHIKVQPVEEEAPAAEAAPAEQPEAPAPEEKEAA